MVISDLYLQRNEGVARILESMFIDQKEHKYCTFGKTYMKYRKIVSEWIIEVCEYFNLHSTTTHAAIAYLDRLQPNEKFSRNEWQMLAICCILISSKYNECEEHVPDFQTLGEITKQNIVNDEVLSYELWALKKMRWKLNVCSPIAFLTAYACVGIIFEEDSHLLSTSSNENSNNNQNNKENIQNHSINSSSRNSNNNNNDKEQEDVFTKTTTALATLCILEPDFKQYQSSIIASAIIYTARKALRCNTIWKHELEILTTHTVKDIMPVVERIWCMYAPLVGLDPTDIFNEITSQESQDKINNNSSINVNITGPVVPEVEVELSCGTHTPINKDKNNNGLKVKLFTPEADKSNNNNDIGEVKQQKPKQHSPTSIADGTDTGTVMGQVELEGIDVNTVFDMDYARKLTYTTTTSTTNSSKVDKADIDVNEWHLLNKEELDVVRKYRLAFM